ncbi:MAG: ABC transporter substrate-binding protein [Eubacteriales bacterium]|nr:ABC transporter substrate-binding protein [Eubacteriales bacterium]
MSNRMKKVMMVLTFATALGLAACGRPKEGNNTASVSTVQNNNTSQSDVKQKQEQAELTAQTVTFTDSAGREVEIPKQIDRIVPSGNLAQMMLVTVAPEKLVGVAKQYGEKSMAYLPETLKTLPELGTFYGKNADMNLEAVLKTEPQIIIDIGEKKKTIQEDMDGLQNQLGVPVVFVEATLENMDQAYLTLGQILGKEEETKKQAAYIRKTLDEAREKAATITEEQKKTVYYAEGDDGLATNPKGSIHADVIDIVGGVNVAEVEMTSGKGGEQISMEQLLAWNPSVIISSSKAASATEMPQDAGWEQLAAVQNGQVYTIPQQPFNFMGRPPAVNRIIGIKWLGHTLYPNVFNYDMIREVKEFYQLFYHHSLQDEDVAKILGQ